MPDPISRLEVCIDRVFGDGYAAQHPELVAAVMQSAASDWAATRLSAALEFIARSLLVEEEEAQHIVPAHELLRPRP
ncbi:MAG: hypothetical protein AUI16_23100 [Alphaproteobacteria bacterium 13_2_20CM_2_64_7]|jgi:hypothetical protein|nr:MAG: hypothetical protein AUI16_23100 [Alphaproteobacteria bacterium 13_2_20CM_2_64_7]